MKTQRLALFVLGAALGWGGAHAATDSDCSMQGVLTSAEETTLVPMREEEKLALDTYSMLCDVWGYEVFLNQSVTAKLGDPGHRWITAQGSFAGAQAELVIDMTSGGLFDSSEVLPTHESGGSILLQFDDCMSGSLYYDIPSIGRSDIVPIRRISGDNIALCEQLAASAASTD